MLWLGSFDTVCGFQVEDRRVCPVADRDVNLPLVEGRGAVI
jgi:hypothetical protein